MVQNTKLKLNFGISGCGQKVSDEQEKLKVACEMGVDYCSQITILKESITPMWEMASQYQDKTILCSVPLYESILLDEPILETIKRQYSFGVRAFTFHLTSKELLLQQKQFGARAINSRGGLFLQEWYKNHNNNPHIEHVGEIQEFFSSHPAEIFIGTSLRPGTTKIETKLYEQEIINAQTFPYKKVIEAGGHISFNDFNKFQKLFNNNEICLMGPITTDSTNGYDHITASTGAVSFAQGYSHINTLLITTPAEHISIPTVEDNIKGIKTFKIAAHMIDLKYNNEAAISLENTFSGTELSCNNGRNLFGFFGNKECNMCGDKCPLRN
jgi:phosphomethylpyrimidine synthase